MLFPEIKVEADQVMGRAEMFMRLTPSTNFGGKRVETAGRSVLNMKIGVGVYQRETMIWLC